MSTDIETKKNKVEIINAASSVIAKVSITIGVLLVLTYCASIGFYPKNIQIGDGLFFIWVALTFGFLISMVTGFFSMLGYSLLRGIKKILPESVSSKIPEPTDVKSYANFHWLAGAVFVFLILAWISSGFIFPKTLDGWIKLFSIILAALANGFILSTLFENNPARSKLFNFGFISLLVVIPCLFISGFFLNTLNGAMDKLGVRDNNATVFIDKDFAALISNVGGEKIEIAKVEDNLFKLKNTVVEFQGVGDTNQVRVCLSESCPSVHIPANKMTVAKREIKEELGKIAKEISTKHADFFKSSGVNFDAKQLKFSFPSAVKTYKTGNDTPSEFNGMLQSELLYNVLPTLSKFSNDITSIEIIGSSSLEWKNSEDQLDAYLKNLELSQSRATSLLGTIRADQRLTPHFSWFIPKLVFVGKSSSIKSEQSIEIRVVVKK